MKKFYFFPQELRLQTQQKKLPDYLMLVLLSIPTYTSTVTVVLNY